MSNRSVIINVDPRALEISNHPSQSRRNSITRRPLPPVVVLPDNDGTLWVADGNARAAIAQREGITLQAKLVEDDYRLGSQTAIDRVMGIFIRKKEW